ncbi:MAG TPA: response regulator [Terriglobales bacterium]|nr:response regulator [Terriglobales bacterium]
MPEPVKILIVDDDEAVLITLERLLEGEGYRTVTAWSGEEALEAAQSGRFDLVLLDEHLSDVEVTTLCDELIRRQPGALRFLMHSRKDHGRSPVSVAHQNVCKWEHGDLKDRIRRCLAA